MEREGEEEHEGTKGGVSLKVNVDVVAAALQVGACSMAVPVSISVVRYEGRPLLLRCSHLPTVQNNPLQHEDHEEAGSHDELWKWETGLFETHMESLMSLQAQSDEVKNKGTETIYRLQYSMSMKTISQ